MSNCLVSPNRALTTDEEMVSAKSRLMSQGAYGIGLLIQKPGSGLIQRNMCDYELSVPSTNPSQYGFPNASCPTCRQFHQRIFPGSTIDYCLYHLWEGCPKSCFMRFLSLMNLYPPSKRECFSSEEIATQLGNIEIARAPRV